MGLHAPRRQLVLTAGTTVTSGIDDEPIAAILGAPAAVEHTIAVAAGKTVAPDVFADLGHRGRTLFRVLTKGGGGAAAATAR